MSVFVFFNKVADDVVNGTGKVLCMKGQCHNRLIEFYPLLVYTYVIFPHDHALAISQVGNLTLLCLVEWRTGLVSYLHCVIDLSDILKILIKSKLNKENKYKRK